MPLQKVLFYSIVLPVILLSADFLVAQPIQCKQFLQAHDISRGLPENLQSTRSAVIISPGNDEPWKELALRSHKLLRKMSVDAVLYFNAKDLYGGDETNQAFISQINSRQIKNLVFVVENEGDAQSFQLVITPFTGNLNPLENKMSAWSISSIDLMEAMRLLANDLIRAEMVNTNFLIPETPYFSEDAVLYKGNKYNVHSRDLKALKLAVKKFEKVENLEGDLKQEIDSYNAQVDIWNNELNTLLERYPFEYKYVASLDEATLYKDGFQYALFNLNTTGINIKKLFNLEIDPGETEYMSLNARTKTDVSLKRISINERVYKFYVKHIVSGDVYIGDKWDTDQTWQLALENYINNLNLFVKR